VKAVVGVGAETTMRPLAAVGVRNEFCAIEFRPDSGALAGILHVPLSDQILKDQSAPQTPFRIHADFPNEWLLETDSERAAKVHLGPEGLALTAATNTRTAQGEDIVLTYTGGGFECRLRVALDAASGDSTWTLAVKNVGRTPRTTQIDFPRFDGVQLGPKGTQNRQTVLDQAGVIADAWSVSGGIYGTGMEAASGKGWSMQWHAMFDPASRSALGLILMDPQIRNKRLVLARPCISVQYFPPQTLAPGQTLTLPPLRVLVYQGDWKRTARAYATWLAKAFVQASQPQWFLESDSLDGKWLAKKSPKPPVFAGGWGPTAGDELMMRLDSFRELPAAVLQYPYDNTEYAYWCQGAVLYGQGIDGDYVVRKDLGGPEALRKAFAEVRQLGLHSTLYHNGYIVHAQSDLAKSGKAKRWALMHRDGSNSGQYTNAGYVHMCIGCAEWQDYLAASVARLLEETGADGVRLDSLGFYFLPCYNPAHHHRSPFDYNEWMKELLSKVRKAALAVNPKALLTTEGPIDFYGQWFHGALTQLYPREIPPMRLAVGPYRPMAYAAAGPVWGSISGLAGGGRMPGADMNWRCASSPVRETLTTGDVADEDPNTTDPEIIARRFMSNRCEVVVATRPACKQPLQWPQLQGLADHRARYEVLIPAGPTPPKTIATCDVETLRWQSAAPSMRDGKFVIATESNWLLVIVPRENERVVAFDPLPETRPGGEITSRPALLAGDGSATKIEVVAPGLRVGEGTDGHGQTLVGEPVSIRVPGDALPGWYRIRIRGENTLGAERMLHVVANERK
jgi:hypothetical protein